MQERRSLFDLEGQCIIEATNTDIKKEDVLSCLRRGLMSTELDIYEHIYTF